MVCIHVDVRTGFILPLSAVWNSPRMCPPPPPGNLVYSKVYDHDNRGNSHRPRSFTESSEEQNEPTDVETWASPSPSDLTSSHSCFFLLLSIRLTRPTGGAPFDHQDDNPGEVGVR